MSYSRFLNKVVCNQNNQKVHAEICNLHTNDCLKFSQDVTSSSNHLDPKNGIKEVVEELLNENMYYDRDTDAKINSLRLSIQAFLEYPEYIEDYLHLFLCTKLSKIILIHRFLYHQGSSSPIRRKNSFCPKPRSPPVRLLKPPLNPTVSSIHHFSPRLLYPSTPSLTLRKSTLRTSCTTST